MFAHSRAVSLSILLILALLVPAGMADGAQELTVFPQGASTLSVLRDGQTYLELNYGGWGPGWSWMGVRGKLDTEGDKAVSHCTAKVKTGATLSIDSTIEAVGPRTIKLHTRVSTDRDTDLTMLIIGLNMGKSFASGQVRAETGQGRRTVDLPIGRKGVGEDVKQFTLVDQAGLETTIALDPALNVTSDGDIRIVLAGQMKTASPREATLMIELPEETTFYASAERMPDEPGFDQWYRWKPKEDYDAESYIAMDDWLDAPAGKHGRIGSRDDKLVYNGKPIKLWGINNCYASCAPEKDLADKRAAMYRRYGINAVRLHKYADGTGWAGIQAPESFLKFDKDKLDRMDYYIARLKENGIYTKLSSTFGVKLGPEDGKHVPFMGEFGKLKGGRGRVSTGHGSVYLSRELQDMQIQQVVKLLNHRNPHTGMKYADDPAIAIVELFNEDSALFFGTMGRLKKIPTLRKRAGREFFNWLKARYGTKEKLLEAWGDGALNSFGNEGLTGESWEGQYIVPAGNPWFYDPTQLAGSQKPKYRRLLDTMLYLYERQNEFYQRYVKAIRATGYEGEILASNWQAGRAFSHYYNLHSDAMVGMIDRHNYFGGGSGSKINNKTMLAVPGSGMLSAGMQQVADRPFSLSEWIHVLPNEWGVEGPAIIGAYGMGLNGWDVSFIFQNRDDGGFLDRLSGRWEPTAPQVLGIFPAVARQIYRGDVAESQVVATRYVSVADLHEGKIGFDDQVKQEWDVKTFDSDKVPARTLSVARCVVEFTDAHRPTPEFDITRYVRDGLYSSTTGQLAWKAGKDRLDGHITIDTPGTKAVVGFAKGLSCRLGDVIITPENRYAAVYVTARDRDATVAKADELLVVAIARARNSGMKVFEDSRIMSKGKAPIVMEPVRAKIDLGRDGATVHVLDHDGGMTDRTLPVRDGRFAIDGVRDKTAYYLVRFNK